MQADVCPIVRLESLHTVFALAVLHQVDVTISIVSGTLEEEVHVFMKQPKGFIVPGREELVRRLKKSIYGLKQSPRCWNLLLDSELKEIGFTQSSYDPYIYYKKESGNMLIIGVHVDDILAENESTIQQVKAALASVFVIKFLAN